MPIATVTNLLGRDDDFEDRPVDLAKYFVPMGTARFAVYFGDGGRLDLIFKICSPRALSPDARRAKPAFLDDPLREIEVYRSLLDSRDLGTAVYYGSVVVRTQDRYWLFLERVAGRELVDVIHRHEIRDLREPFTVR